MIAMAISLLWLLIGVIVLCAVIWLVIYGITNIAGVPIPERIIQAIWFVVAILIIIGILTILAGGSIGGFSLHRL
jgi:hypothetical protein